MRIRSIKPEFWRSDDITSLPITARLTFIGMWSYVDDNGVGNARASSIIGDLYAEDMARDPQETLKRVSGDLQQLESKGLLIKYRDPHHPSRELYYVTNWQHHQVVNRPSKGHEYPLPPPEIVEMSQKADSTHAECMSVSGVSHECLSAGAGEQGSRGTGEQGSRGTSEIAKAIPRHDVTQILDHLDQRLKANGVKIPNRTQKNLDAARLLIDRDKRTVEQIIAAIDYATNNEFWRTNILSMSKLREKYDQLRLQASRTPSNSGTPPPNRVQQNMAVVARMAAQADQPRKEITQ